MTALVLELRVDGSASIETVATEMQAAANAVRIDVEVLFQGVRIRAVPLGLASATIAAFEAAQAGPAPALGRYASSTGGEDDEVPVPVSVSRRQFAQGAAETGAIDWSEAEAWSAGTALPAFLAALIDAVPDDAERGRARMFLLGARDFERRHPMTISLAASLGWSEADLDDLWRLAATL